MRDYVVGDDLPFLHGRLQRIQDAAYRIAANRRGQWNEAAGMAARQQCLDALKRISDRESAGFANVWLGVSVEDQARADERIPLLLQTPAALRWLSCEPLLGPVDLTCLTISGDSEMDCLNPRDWADEVEQWRGTSDSWEDDFEDWFGRFPDQVSGTMHPTIDWVVAGGESGRGARPMHPDWARRLRDDCAHARVPFLFKQWGAWEPAQADDDCQHVHQWVCPPDTDRFGPIDRTTDALMRLVGKKDAGRHLDGRLHDGFPA
jgi:protein gp37